VIPAGLAHRRLILSRVFEIRSRAKPSVQFLGTSSTIIGHIKEFSSLNLSKHRSVINAFVHIIAAITAYQINLFKPKLNLQPCYQLETTA
jgi:hypothetical protein